MNRERIPIRSYVSNFNVHFGAGTTFGRLIPVALDDKSGLHYCTPEGQAVHQQYVDDTGKTYSIPELAKGSENDDGTYTVKEAVAIKKAKASTGVPNGNIYLKPHPVEEVTSQVVADGYQYVFEPGQEISKKWVMDIPHNDKWYAYMCTALDNPDVAFMGIGMVKNTEGLYQAKVWNGQLVLQRYHFPESIRPEIPAEVESAAWMGAQRQKVRSHVEALTEGFNVNDYKSQTTQNMQSLISDDVLPESNLVDFDIMAALEDFEKEHNIG